MITNENKMKRTSSIVSLCLLYANMDVKWEKDLFDWSDWTVDDIRSLYLQDTGFYSVYTRVDVDRLLGTLLHRYGRSKRAGAIRKLSARLRGNWTDREAFRFVIENLTREDFNTLGY